MGTKEIVKWVTDNAAGLAVAVTAIVALSGGAWAVWIYEHAPEGAVVVKYHVCFSKKKSACPSGTLWVSGDPSQIPEWVRNECQKYKENKVASYKPKPDYTIVDVTCSTGGGQTIEAK